MELMKGSLNTFLNAFTYPDRTCYPVASANLQVGCLAGGGSSDPVEPITCATRRESCAALQALLGAPMPSSPPSTIFPMGGTVHLAHISPISLLVHLLMHTMLSLVSSAIINNPPTHTHTLQCHD